MRLHQYFRPSIAHVAVAGAAAVMFAFGMPLSAFGQTSQAQQASNTPAVRPVAQAPQPASVVNGTPVSMEDAVRMALENNLGIQGQRLDPQIQSYAVARANAGDLGLAASVWSGDEERAFSVAARLDAGFTFVNTHNRTGMSLRAPFGGVKRSGWGREYGDEGVLEHTQPCVVHAPGAFRAGGAGLGAAAYPG